MPVIGIGNITILDLNEAIVGGPAPKNPSVGTLWIDKSSGVDVLKSWNGTVWVVQNFKLSDLDPGASNDLTNVGTKLGNLADDSKLVVDERQIVLEKLYDILGTLPTAGAVLPVVATVNAYTSGSYYNARKAAEVAKVPLTNASYTGLATAYTNLSTYLNGVKNGTVYPWDTSTANKDVVISGIIPTTWLAQWRAYYEAELLLEQVTAKRIADAQKEAEDIQASKREGMVINGYGDLGNNKNFSATTFQNTASDIVSGKGSFRFTGSITVRSDEYIGIEPDNNYYMEVTVKSSTTTGSHNIGVECYNSSDTSLGVRWLVRTSADSQTLPSTTSWVSYGGVVLGQATSTDTLVKSFPTGTTRIKIRIDGNIGAAANVLSFADVHFARDNVQAGKNYNGVKMDAVNGVTVTSSKNVVTMNATKGIEIKRSADNFVGFSVDTNGNVAVNGILEVTSSNSLYTKTEIESALVSNSLGIGVQFDKLTFNGATTANTMYVHGLTLNATTKVLEPANVNGYIKKWDNSGNITITPQAVDLRSGPASTDTGYLVYDDTTGVKCFWFIVYSKANDNWTRYNVGKTGHATVLTFSDNIYVIGEISMT